VPIDKSNQNSRNYRAFETRVIFTAKSITRRAALEVELFDTRHVSPKSGSALVQSTMGEQPQGKAYSGTKCVTLQ